jgi:menaquinone-dependent protoporphyrinogen oxidase
MDDPSRVLVGYATAAGSTAGIAERIAETLRDSGCDVVCRPVGPDLDPKPFSALVVGSAVHNMAWRFSVVGVAPHGAVTRRMTALEVRKVEQAFPPAFRPREHCFFGGIVEMKGVPLWGRVFWRMIGGRPGDHRDWPAIEDWAQRIATEVTNQQKPAGQKRE